MNLAEVTYPVYLLGKQEPIQESGLSYYLYTKIVKEGDDIDVVKIIDDLRVPQPTLGKRRLALKVSGKTLQKLRYAVYFLADLVKLSKGQTWFIDSVGRIFSYKKSTRVPLIFKPIKNVLRNNSGTVLVEVEGVPTRFKIIYAPKPTEKYAGLLKVGAGWVLYGLYQEEHKSTIKMI